MGNKALTLKELRLLSDEELREVSLRKNKKGCHTQEANLAQKVRNERAGVMTFGPDCLKLNKSPSYAHQMIEMYGNDN